MADYPVNNLRFSIEEAIRDFGFQIDDKGGPCVAHGYYYALYGEIFIEFLQSFITNFQTDMHVFYIDEETHETKTLFYGVAPVNKRDFKMLMSYILPSESFITQLGIME